MKAAWVMMAAGLAAWACADSSLARPHHKKKAAAAASSSSSDSASSGAPAAADDTQPAQQPMMPPSTAGAKPAALVANSPATTQYNPAAGFPDHNGPLSAMLVVIPRGELQEFDRPAGAGRHLDRVSRAEPGAQLAIKMVFVGVKPDWNANANVTYDLQVVAPNGKIYGNSDYKGLIALQGRVATTGDPGMYDNRPKVVVMQFEPQDQVGLYKIRAVLHDNVAKLDVPLEAGVELLQKGAVPARAPMTPAPATGSATAAATSAPVAGAAASSAADASMSPVADDSDPPVKKKRRRHH